MPTAATPGFFTTTHWSVVLEATDPGKPAGFAALGQLCSTYWYPVYAQIRRRGYAESEAPDLTQEFFASLLRHDSLASVRRERGRFRTFLIRALGNFLADDTDRRRALKRGGGMLPIPLDAVEAAERYAIDPATHDSPDVLFDRHWLEALMARVFERLAQEQAALGKAELFQQLRPYLGQEVEAGAYSDLEPRLGLKRNTIAVTVSRLRQRCRELALSEVMHTVADPADAEAELRQLLG